MTNSEAARMFKAFSDEKRLNILTELGKKEQCATELVEKLHIGQSTLSHHMKILCDAGIVDIRRQGTFSYYSISKEGGRQVKAVLDAIIKMKGYKEK